MQALLPTTLIALLLTSASFSTQGQTTPPPEVIEPDGVCTQITIPDPDNPAPATIEVNDETDPDCHTPGIIYQQADDTVIDATVETTGTDWATRCRALGKTVGPLAAGHGGNEPHTFEETTRTRQISSSTSGCITITVVALDDGRRDRTVFDCREGGAHITPAGDGHAHEWLTEPWEPWQWTETGRRANINNNNCPQDTPNFDPIDFPPSGEGGREETGTTSTDEGDRVPQGTTSNQIAMTGGLAITLSIGPDGRVMGATATNAPVAVPTTDDALGEQTDVDATTNSYDGPTPGSYGW